jgi:sugar phosphate isomerase/epimerase
MTKRIETTRSDRRGFLKGLAVSSGALMLGGGATKVLPQPVKIDPKWKNQIGLGLYSVDMSKDYEGVLKILVEIGYKEIEPTASAEFEYPLSYNSMEPKAYRAMLDKYGLKARSTHSGPPVGLDGSELEKVLAGFQEMGILYADRAQRPNYPFSGGSAGGAAAAGGAPGAGSTQAGGGGLSGGMQVGGRWAKDAREQTPMLSGMRGSTAMPGGGMGTAKTVESIRRSAEEMNKYGAIFKKFGMKLLVHNHTDEFAPLDDNGQTQYDIVLAETDPDLVTMQLDIGWAAAAGMNILEMFARNPGRYELWHVKDVLALKSLENLKIAERREQTHMCPVGLGDIDYKSIFAAANVAGLKYFCIEQDNSARWGDDIAACRVSFQNLKKMLS